MITVCTVLLWSYYDTGRGYFVIFFLFRRFLAVLSHSHRVARERKMSEIKIEIRAFRYVSRYLGWIFRKEIRWYYFPAYSRVRRAAAYNKSQRSISEEFISGLLVGRNNVTVPLDAIVFSLILFTTMIVLAYTNVPDEPINNRKVTRTIITTFLGHPKISKRFDEGNFSFPLRGVESREKKITIIEKFYFHFREINLLTREL